VEPVIRATNIRKRYGDVTAVDDVTVTVARGEVFGVVGPNGAGKSTTVEMLQGLRRPDRGEVRILGSDPVADPGPVRQRVGTQLQQAVLPDRLRVREALRLYASYYERPASIDRLLEEWGLTDKQDATFESLSGGQKQRLFIALALVGSPEVVFLDELTTGLDPAARRATWEHVRRIRDAGVTVVLVTHFMDEAEQLCDRIAVIDGGRVVAAGTPASLVALAGGTHTVTFGRPAGFETAWLEGLDDVASVEVHRAQGEEVVRVRGGGSVLAGVVTALSQHGLVPDDISVDRAGLEDAFLALTGRPATDGAALAAAPAMAA
jgi:ABC-2 type transport system ATP-binding protein